MASDSDPRIAVFEASGMPDTFDLSDDEAFNLEGATNFFRSAAEHKKESEAVGSHKSDETNCSVEVDVENVESSKTLADGLSEKSVNDIYPPVDYENFEIDEDEAIAELKVLELKILHKKDDRYLKSISELARGKTDGDYRSPLQHLNFLMERHRDSIGDLVDIFLTE